VRSESAGIVVAVAAAVVVSANRRIDLQVLTGPRDKDLEDSRTRNSYS
jgi:hypothetical protein